MADDRARRRLAAILAADVAGYSRLIGLDEEGTLAAMRGLRREVLDSLLKEHGGRVANTAGDSLLVEFASVVDAVRYAIAMQQAVAARSADLPEERRVLFRIGINLGDVVSEGTDLLGDGVNIAARLESLAAVGGIAISDDAHRQIRDRIDQEWFDSGEQELKNIARPVRVWRWPAEAAPSIAKSAPAAEKPSIAILPFENMSGDQEQQYFSDGIIEDVIAKIAKIPDVLVISRNSSFTYKGKAVKAQEVCRDLGVRYILEGSVRRANERVRITARLIDGRTDAQLWAERYDRDLADIFAVQDDVTERIVSTLAVKLAGGQRRTARNEPEDPEAYDCVLRGRERYRQYSKEGNAAARQLYERAIELQSDYAEAYAGLAETHLHDWFHGDPEALDRAFALAQKARELDESLPLVYEALSSISLFKRRHEDSVAAAERWLEIEPGNAEAHANLAGILHFAGAPERVAGLIATAKQLNPFYPFYYTLYVGQALFTMRRFAEAAPLIARSVAHNPDALPSQFFLAACYGQLGEVEKARDALAEARRISPDLSIERVKGIASYKRDGDLELLLEGLRKAGFGEEELETS